MKPNEARELARKLREISADNFSLAGAYEELAERIEERAKMIEWMKQIMRG